MRTLPSTPPSQSAPGLPLGTTPVKPAVYPALKELRASKAHRLAGRALNPTIVAARDFWEETLGTAANDEAAQLSGADCTTLKKQYHILATLLKPPKRSDSDSFAEPKKAPKPVETASYVPTTIIMNVLSLAHAKAHPLPDDKVVGWFLNPTQYLFGDSFAKSLKPDIVACLVPRKTAEAYLKRLQTKTTLSSLNELRPAWAQMISAAELKVSAPGQSQLLNYLESICCYRPDLVSVVAISAKLDGYQFYSLNAVRCLTHSKSLKWNDTNTPSLQKFIAAVYQTQTSRYEDMNYLEGSLQGWSLERGSKSARRWHMLPFHTGHYPGRGTWIACAIETTETTETTEATEATETTEATEATAPKPKLYIVKSYWADAGSKRGEGDLYDDAHSDVKIPGLAHIVDHWKTGKEVLWSRKPNGPIIKREQVCVILGSTGRPLNECGTVDDILRCTFDLLETLRVMCHRDVIHRDISWGNVMIHPTHSNSVVGPVVSHPDKNRPLYMSELLGEGQNDSLSLLTDLDCSAKLRGLQEDAQTGRHSRTGTPMFIAMEISSHSVRWGPFPLDAFMVYLNGLNIDLNGMSSSPLALTLNLLGRKVKEQQRHVIAHEVSSKSNMKNAFEAYLGPAPTSESKQTPIASKPEPKPPLVHTLRHDAESVFWLLWFLLARANPRGEAPVEKESAERKDYDHFCSTMLNHTVGTRTDSRESLIGMSIEQYRQTLHPRFAHLGDMLYFMGRYFLIDPEWSDYNKDLLDHAYDFMQFLLLQEMLRNKESNESKNRKLPLNTTRPRPATDHNAAVRCVPAVSFENRKMNLYAASVSQDCPVVSSVSSSGSKRKPDADPEGSPVPKRRRSSRLNRNQDHAALADAPQTGAQPEIAQPERNPFFPTPERAGANEEDGRTSEDENEGKSLDLDDPDEEQADYVESQETPETKKGLEEDALRKANRSRSFIEAFKAADRIQSSMLCGEQWFTLFKE